MHNPVSIKNLQKRLLVVIILITFLFVAIILRLGVVQLASGEWLRAKAKEQWMRDLPIKASRGVIYDRTGSVLATNYSTYDVYVRPKNIEDHQAVAKVLSDVLQFDYDKTYSKVMRKNVSEVLISLQISVEQKNLIQSYNLSGIVFSENAKRYYPYSNLLTQVLGYTTVDGDGQAGLEAYYNKYLKGVNGYVLNEADAAGKNKENTQNTYIPAIPGMDLITTIDSKIQLIIENAAFKALVEQKAKSVTAIMMESQTGAIVGLTTKDSFNLNEVPRDDITNLFNMTKTPAIVDVYEPGSTFKVLTSAIAINNNSISLDNKFFCGGSCVVDGQKIKCWRSKGHGSQNYTEGFCNSCNCVFVSTALKVGTTDFYKGLKTFGIGKKTNIDFYGESNGILMNEKTVKNVDLARIGFGHAVAVTPLQLLNSINSATNGGKFFKPYFASQIVSSNGEIVYKYEPSVISYPISEQTSAVVRQLMEESVSHSKGYMSFVPGYRIGGKTGTAQKYENGVIAQGKYVSSFVGIYPADSPKYTLLFLVDEPSAGQYYGSVVASPYAKEIFSGTISYLGDKKVNDELEPEKNIKMPFVEGLSVYEAESILNKLSIQCEIYGDGEFITKQFPVEGEMLFKGQVITLNAEKV